jgi:hypothetical protein
VCNMVMTGMVASVSINTVINKAGWGKEDIEVGGGGRQRQGCREGTEREWGPRKGYEGVRQGGSAHSRGVTGAWV